MNIKKWNAFNENFDQSIDTMKNTTVVYNKYKNKINTIIQAEDLNKSAEDFNKFIESLSDEEKEASDLLRSYFNSEMIKEKIELLEQNKQDIEKEIKSRIEELKAIQNSLP